MGYWGWRRILTGFVSVLVVGCTLTYQAAPTIPPTSLPPVTLIARGLITPTPPSVSPPPQVTPPSAPTALAYAIQPGDTLLGIAAQFGVSLQALQAANTDLNPLALPIGVSLIIPNPHFNAQGIPILPTATPVSLVLISPVCQPTATGSIICLGKVINTLAQGVQRVNLHLRLLRRDGSILSEGDVGIEQAFIPSGGSAPYRAFFKTDWQAYAGVSAWLESAEIINEFPQAFVHLDIREERVWLTGSRYTVAALLSNPNPDSAHLMRAVLTIEDASGQIIAFRVMPLSGSLAVGETIPLEISVMAESPITHTLYVEAERESPD